MGENGIITKAKSGKLSYEQASVEEKVKIALLDYNTEKITKGEEGMVQEALTTLLENKTFDEIEEQENIGIAGEYYITLGKENGEIIITEIEQIMGQTRIKYALSQNTYTKDPITITIKATGITELRNPDNEEVPVTEGNAETTYTVNKNGTYLFTAKDMDGNPREKRIVVNKIDTLSPKEFQIEIEKIGEDGIKIIAQTEDKEATEESACSGIEKYEYYISYDGENYEKYTSNTITGINVDTCYVYVVAYDKAGNYVQSETIKTINGKKPNYIFYQGEQYEEITGGWARTGYHTGSGTVTIREDYIYLKGAMSKNRPYAGIQKKIDFSKYTTMVITYSGQGEYEFSDVDYYNNSYDNYRVAISYSTDGELSVTLEDVGEKYLHFTNCASNRTIYLFSGIILK